MAEFKRKLYLDVTITADHGHTADAVLVELTKKLADHLPECLVEGTHSITGDYRGEVLLGERVVRTRGPRAKKAAGKKKEP